MHPRGWDLSVLGRLDELRPVFARLTFECGRRHRLPDVPGLYQVKPCVRDRVLRPASADNDRASRSYQIWRFSPIPALGLRRGVQTIRGLIIQNCGMSCLAARNLFRITHPTNRSRAGTTGPLIASYAVTTSTTTRSNAV